MATSTLLASASTRGAEAPPPPPRSARRIDPERLRRRHGAGRHEHHADADPDRPSVRGRDGLPDDERLDRRNGGERARPRERGLERLLAHRRVDDAPVSDLHLPGPGELGRERVRERAPGPGAGGCARVLERRDRHGVQRGPRRPGLELGEERRRCPARGGGDVLRCGARGEDREDDAEEGSRHGILSAGRRRGSCRRRGSRTAPPRGAAAVRGCRSRPSRTGRRGSRRRRPPAARRGSPATAR